MRLDEITEHPEDYEEVELVLENCKPFLKSIDWSPVEYKILRGMEETRLFSEKQVRKNRKPRDMEQFLHDAIDNWFLKNIGYRFRSNAIFGTSDHMEIIEAEYGEAHIIFPKGNFEIAWSPKAKDLYAVIDREIQKLASQQQKDRSYIRTYQRLQHESSYLEKFINSIMKEYNYQTGNVKQAIKSGNEIMIACDSYYATSMIDRFPEMVERVIKDEKIQNRKDN